MKKIAVVLILAVFAVAPAVAGASPAIEFEFRDETSLDLSLAASGVPIYAELDSAKYGTVAGKYLIHEMSIPLKSGDEYRMLLTCSSLDKSGACRGIQMVVLDERKRPASVIQRLKLGDGYVPQILFPTAEDHISAMFRVIRANDNTEAHVYYVNSVTGRLTKKLTITRSFPEKMKLKITCVMKAGGIIEAESGEPALKHTVDLSSELDSLIEDEIYQPDGSPMPALINLKLARNGWEEESIYSVDGETRVNVGMSLVTLSKKPVVDVTVVFGMDDEGNWSVSDIRFEPSLPYRSD
jgi:hypothetical protein